MKSPTTTPAAPALAVPKPRADAVRNRERILVAAREMLVESGVEAPLDEIARRAGVGNATLYRHFPDRAALVHHVVLFVTDRVSAHAERALAEEPDAFAALRRFTHAAADERIGALCPMLADDFDREHPELLVSRDALEEAVQALLAAGQDSGLVRADIGVGDLMMALSQLSRPLPGTACLQVDRFVTPSPRAVPRRVAGPGPLGTARRGGHARRPETENHVTPRVAPASVENLP